MRLSRFDDRGDSKVIPAAPALSPSPAVSEQLSPESGGIFICLPSGSICARLISYGSPRLSRVP